MAVVKINAIEVPEGAGPELERRFANRLGAVDSAPGFISYELLRPTAGETRYFVMTHWETRKHFEDWVRSDEFVQGHARSGSLPREAYSAPNKLELHEVILDSTRPDMVPEPHGKPFAIHHGE